MRPENMAAKPDIAVSPIDGIDGCVMQYSSLFLKDVYACVAGMPTI
jgi:hypothetical protein